VATFDFKKGQGFAKIPNYLLDEPRLRPAEFRVLCYLARYGTQPTFPSYTTIVDATGLSEQTITTAVAGLVALNIIWKDEVGSRQTPTYHIFDHDLWNLSSRDSRQGKGKKIKVQKGSRAKKYWDAKIQEARDKAVQEYLDKQADEKDFAEAAREHDQQASEAYAKKREEAEAWFARRYPIT
jgi:hypothetical protein